MTILKLVSVEDIDHITVDARYNFVTYENQAWHKCTARVNGLCSHTGMPYAMGSVVYRPTGSPANRAQRIIPEVLVQFGVTGINTELVRTCDQCGLTLPLTKAHFAHPKNKAEFRTTCRNCMNELRYEKKRATEIAKASVPQDDKPANTRLVTFPDSWRPNREGMRSSTKDLLGIKSSMGD